MTKIIDRNGKGSDINVSEFDANYSSLAGINEAQTGTTHTIDINDQNKTIEYSNASAVVVTLTLLSTITSTLHTDDYRVIILSTGVGGVTINTNASDSFNDGSTSITLLQDEAVEIQSSASVVMWNVLRKLVDAVSVTGTQTLTNKTLTSPVINSPVINSPVINTAVNNSPVINTAVSGTAFLDEDNMSSNSATKIASQQSIKAYVDNTLQIVTAVDSAYQSTTSLIPSDDTIPTVSEGLSLVDVTITPKYSNSKLHFVFECLLATGSTTGVGVVTLIDVTGVSTLKATAIRIDGNLLDQISLHHVQNSPGTSANTYRIRVGPGTAGTTYINGTSAGRRFGGAAGATLTVMEIM